MKELDIVKSLAEIYIDTQQRNKTTLENIQSEVSVFSSLNFIIAII